MKKHKKQKKQPNTPRCPLTGHRIRHDGWNQKRVATFLTYLSITGCIREAAMYADMSKTSAYRLYKRDPEFAVLWDIALNKACFRRGLVRSFAGPLH